MGFITATALFLLAVTAIGSVVIRAVLRFLARRRFVAEHCASQNPDAVITLIHGTWARDASWTQPDSPLCVALRAAFPRARLVPFVWSGANTMAGRRKGSQALVTHLRASIHRHPDAHHYIIAHSHGGNIAMYALREDDIKRRVDGVVCLSTPFLHVRPREVPRVAKFALVGSALMLPLMLRELVAEWCCTPDQVVVTEWLGVPVAIAAGVLLIVALPAAAIRTSLGVSLPQLEPSRCLFIRASGDEASAALGALQLMNWIVTVFWVRPAELLQAGYDMVLEWSASLSRYDRRVGWSVVASTLCLALGAGVANSTTVRVGDLLVGLGLLGLSAALAFALVRLAPGNFLVYGFFLLGMMFAPLPLLLALVLLPFGPGLAPFATLLDVSAEPTPPGAWKIYQLPTRPLEQAIPLMHSASYQLPEAIGLVVTWISERQTVDDIS